MRLFYQNLIDAAAVVISETSEVSTLPSSNVAHEFRDLPWRTGTSVALEAVTFDLGSAQAVTSSIILDHTLTASDTLIQLRGSTDNFAASNVLVATFTHAADVMAAIFNSVSYRYWRFTFTKSAAGESRDIGRIFIGTYYETEDAPDYDGFDEENDDLSRKSKTLGGQTYTEALPSFAKLRCKFSHISTTMKASLKTYWASVGEAVAHFVQVTTSSPFDSYYYVKLNKPVKFHAAAQDTSPVWDTELEFEEQL